MDSNITIDHSLALSKDFDTEGFDLQAGKSWIYPTNYPTRDYQFNIIQKALLNNTLVSLPTGLGKTFIAAVVMYNFYRWYPRGKIIFMAPTKPLVKQQVDACYNVMAIPPESTAELTGAKVSILRANLWIEKRVFFVTPQVLQNDLNKIAELGESIKCLVFDEAHKARGNHAYCEVIRRFTQQNRKYFRVLALSATPGSNVNDVLEVIQNLMISHLEFRTEESLDVKPYVYERSLETIVVPLGRKLEQVKDEYLKNLEYYVKTLRKLNVIQGNCGALTKGKIFIIMRDFQNKHKGLRASNYAEIMRCLNICVTLYHAYELLIRHGLRNFLSFFDEHIEKPLLKGNTHIKSILNDVRDYLGPIPNVEVLPDGTFPQIPEGIVFGHPKYYKLRDILVSHFKKCQENTRVIVFFEYRESVMEAHTMLLQSRPLIQPKVFLGQGAGITQKVQIGVVKAFREGKCNTLLSTCIGEEGLDVGEVDLIVCFDVSSKSPIRMVQRMGRTGRKREGKVLVLVTEGREQQTLKDCLIHKSNISTFVLGSKQLADGMYGKSPRLVPEQINPKCERIFITVKKIEKKKTLKDMLRSVSSNSSEIAFSQNLQIAELPDRIPKSIMLFNRVDPLNADIKENNVFCKHIEKQRNLQKSHITHSTCSKLLADLLNFADSKRFNLPTQLTLSQVKQKNLKQGDIRNMFFQTTTQQDFISQTTNTVFKDTILLNFTQEHQEPQPELPNISKEVFTLIENYLLTELHNSSRLCRHCPTNFKCKEFSIPSPETESTKNNNWVPSDDIIETISLSDLKTFHNILLGRSQEDNNDIAIFDDLNTQIFEEVDFTQFEKETNGGHAADQEKSVHFEAPKSYLNLLDKFSSSIFESHQTQQQNREKIKVLRRESVQDLTEEELLKMFKLDSLIDIFGEPSMNASQETLIYSPSISNVDKSSEESALGSPILSSCKVKRKLIKKQKYKNKKGITEISPPKYSVHSSQSKNSEKNKLTQNTSLNSSIDIDELCDLSYFGIPTIQQRYSPNNSGRSEIDKKCDSSQFGSLSSNDTGDAWNKETNKLLDKHFSSGNFKTTEKQQSSLNSQELVEMYEVCDTSEFELLQKMNEDALRSEVSQKNDKSQKKQNSLIGTDLSQLDEVCDLSQFGLLSCGVGGDAQNKNMNSPKNLKKHDPNDSKSSQKNEKPNEWSTISNGLDLTQIDEVCDLAQFGLKSLICNENIRGKIVTNTRFSSGEPKNNQKGKQKPKKINDSIVLSEDEMDFDLPMQMNSKFPKSSVKNTQKQKCKTPLKNNSEEDFDFDSITQISHSNKTAQKNGIIIRSPILTKKTCQKFTLSSSMVQKKLNSTFSCTSQKSFTQNLLTEKQNMNIEFSMNPNNSVSNISIGSQLSVTQILDLVNDSQKENCTNYRNISITSNTPKSESSILDNLDNHTVFNKSFAPSSLNNTKSKKNTRNRSVLNSSLNETRQEEPDTDSSDEFDDFAKPRLPTLNKTKIVLKKHSIKRKNESVGSNKRRRLNDFLDLEAELSADDDVFVSDDETEEDLNCYEKSFVNDETQNINTQMHANYLQSIRSPVNPGQFKIPQNRVHVSNVYSQPVANEDDNYMEDSFCVDTDEEEATESHEISELEILERKLKEQRKRKKSKENVKKSKRRRIVLLSSDSE